MRDPVFLIRAEDKIQHHVKLFKQCSTASFTIKLTTKTTDIDRAENLVVLSSEESINLTKMGYDQRVLLVSLNGTKELETTTKINQNILLLSMTNQTSWSLSESYTVNDMTVRNTIGRFAIKKDNQSKNGTLGFHGFLTLDLVERRGNFHGLQLIGMSLPSVTFSTLKDGYNDKSNYIPENETFDVTNFVAGFYPEVYNVIMEELNFTTRLYSRKDGYYGGQILSGNGSLNADGAVGDLFYGRAEVLVAPMTKVNNREAFVDFLPTLSQVQLAYYIRNDAQQEIIDWDLYLSPWSRYVWLVLVILALGMTLLLSLADVSSGMPCQVTKVQQFSIISKYNHAEQCKD